METLLTIGVCILAVLLELAVAALIVAPKAAMRWLRRLAHHAWCAVTRARGRVGAASTLAWERLMGECSRG